MRTLIVALVLNLAVITGAQAQLTPRLFCDPTDNDLHAAQLVITEIKEMERAIIEALRAQTGQLAGYEAQSAFAVTSSIDAQTRLLAQVLREVEESEATRAYQPTAEGCRTTTGVAGLAAGPARAAQGPFQAARPPRGGGAPGAGRAGPAEALFEASIRESGRITQDLAVVAPGGATADTAARFNVIRTTYCSGERTGQDACQGVAEHHGLDQIPATLFTASTLEDPQARHASREVGRNLAAPVITEPIPWDAATTPAERSAALRERAAQTRTALSSEFFAHARAQRLPAVNLGEWAAALAPALERDASRPLSRHELLEFLASRRYDDPGWSVALETMGTQALLREISRQMALGLILDWERYLLEERRGAMEAARLAIAVEESRALPGLAAAPGVN